MIDWEMARSGSNYDLFGGQEIVVAVGAKQPQMTVLNLFRGIFFDERSICLIEYHRVVGRLCKLLGK